MSRLNSFYKPPLYPDPEAEGLLEAVRQDEIARAGNRIIDGPIAAPVADEDRVRTAQDALWNL